MLYARDLAAAEDFYGRVLGLTLHAKDDNRHVFYKLESQMLLIFNPEATRTPSTGTLPVPAHGATGDGHVCFAAAEGDLEGWRTGSAASASQSKRISNGRAAAIPSMSAIPPATPSSSPSHASGDFDA